MRFIVVVFTFFLFSNFAFGQNLKIVVIDPGHGGHDSGAIGINGILEKDIVLRIALKTEALNAFSKESRLQIYLTRYTDTFISLKDRSILPKVLKADLFISLHCNYSTNPDVRGIEVFLHDQKNMTESLEFAIGLENEFKSSIGFESRGIKFANFQVIKDVSRICKSVLFEIGYLSNRDEARYLDKNIGNNSVYAIKESKRKFRIMKELFEAVDNLLELIIRKIFRNVLCKLPKDLS